MASVYQALGAYLGRQSGPTCVLTFGEIEARLGRALPPSAYARRGWWNNRDVPPHAYHGWVSAGWRIASVDMERQVVTFRKG
jgi:hypothetical protein